LPVPPPASHSLPIRSSISGCRRAAMDADVNFAPARPASPPARRR
jgi:hypothetical protein